MRDPRVQQAAHNNAAWCDTVCRAHGRPGEFFDAIWINRHEPPRFYPSVVTLTAAGCSMQFACINDLVAMPIAREWAVKDSFSTLDLTSLGFRPLFEAQWIYRSVSPQRPDDRIAGIRWVRVDREAALTDWEMAWGGEAHDERVRIFLPGLLANEDVAVIAAYRDQQIVAGAVANRAADVVGLSNVFVPARDGEHFWAGCVAAAVDAFPGLPIVGYEAGQALARAQALGFNTLGPLRVWARAHKAIREGQATEN